MSQPTAEVLIQPATYSKSKALTITAHIARVILGLIFLVFGLNGFLHFMPMQLPTGTAGEFVFGLAKAGYFLSFMSFIQVICGVLLLSGTLVPLALLMLAPIALNIFLFHLFLSPANLGMAVFIIAAVILLAVYYWHIYIHVFKTENAWKSKRA